MTDKVQKIREEVERLQIELIQEKENGFGSDADDTCILELQNVLTYIDSLQEEPVSEELDEAAKRYATEGDEISGLYIIDEEVDAFKAGAKWKENQMKVVYVITRCEEHSDYVEEVFFDEDKAQKYCDQFNGNDNEYARQITKVKVTL